MNYSFGRLRFSSGAGEGARTLTLVLRPGFASPEARGPWSGVLNVRLYARQPVLLEAPVRESVRLAPGARMDHEFALPAPPWPLDEGFFPLGHLIADTRTGFWSREIPLSPTLAPAQP